MNEKIIKIDTINNLIPLGKIIGAYSIKGEFIVKPYQININDSSLLNIKKLFILPKINQILDISQINIIQAKCYKNGILILSKEFTNPEEIKKYNGCELAVTREQLPKTSNDEFYWVDLIDKQVLNTKGELLGIVNRMMDNGVQSILCIHPKKNTALIDEILIPFTETYIIKVANDIIVDWDAE